MVKTRPQVEYCFRIFRSFVFVLIFLLIIPPLSFADSGSGSGLRSGLRSGNVSICFYSCESNINNYKSLKINFDNYLSRFGPYEFQPFKDKNTFEEHIEGRTNCLIILSSWHYLNLSKNNTLQPVLVGEKNSKKMQKRVVVCKDSPDDVKTVLQSLSSASSARHTMSIVDDIFKDDDIKRSVKILSVPKDIDALMSVCFGMSKSALVTQSSFERLKILNPELYKEMTVLAEGKKAFLLILAAPEKISNGCNSLLKIIKDMPDDPTGSKVIKMLGVDSLQDLEPKDREKLEKSGQN
jgi:hypothetical protein